MKMRLTEKSIEKLEGKGRAYDVRDETVNGLLVRVGLGGSKTYYLDYRDGSGKRSRYRIGSTGIVPLAAAREQARGRGGQVAGGQNLNKEKKQLRAMEKAKKHEKLGFFIDEVYKPWRQAERKRADEEMERLDLHFRRWYSKSMPEITEGLIFAWRQERIKAGISAKTINRDIACLRSVLSHAVRVKVLDHNPLAEFKPLKTDDRGKVRFLSDAEDQRLRSVLEGREKEAREARKNHNKWLAQRKQKLKPEITDGQFSDHIFPIILVLLNTGVRPEELLHMEWRDIDYSTNTLTVRGEIAKSGRTRHVPLSTEAQKVLKNWRKSSKSKSLVFPGRTGKPMDRLPRAVTKAIKAANIEDFRPYDLRHTFASWLVMRGIDLNTVRDLLGHESIQMTLIYAHLSQDHRREAVQKVFG